MKLRAVHVGWRRLIVLVPGLLSFLTQALANPIGPTVGQGSASFSSQGSQFTIRTSDMAAINWQSFNIGAGQTTTFLQPSSSSVVWNQINGTAPSQILGTLNANGYVVLQNQAGFYIGGQAVLNTHGLLMTTAPMPVPDLSSGGPWQFNAPPPTASIINYGQMNIDHGGSIFLIAQDIQNRGTINAPEGNIGLYAGKQVLVSQRPDGRGLSAQVTLPEGSVDNSGKIIADAGTIAMHAQVVNQGGLVQANSLREVNGVIELVASDTINLGANSSLSAQGGSQGTSPGGTISVKSGGKFSDETGSTINVSGGTQGGNGGNSEISAANLGPIQSAIDAHAGVGFLGGTLTIDPYDLTLDRAFVSSLTPVLNNGLYQINLQADHDITLSTLWTLNDPGAAAKLSLTAGNNITLLGGSGIRAGNNWSVNMSAGPQNLASKPVAGTDGIYLRGNSFIQTLNGDINLWAANEVIVNPGPPYALGSGDPGNNGIRTLKGGNIAVTALFGDVNTGGNFNGYLFGQNAAPYYKVSPNLGGISTAAGGDVTITAGGNVASYLPVQSDYPKAKFDGGSGAFGPQPGNVTINAGGDVFGHYVVANGLGKITAAGDIGSQIPNSGFALSLVKGSWTVSAPNGGIYLQDARNPAGVFNDKGGNAAAYDGYHLFDYDQGSSLTLSAGKFVEITGADAPHAVPSAPGANIPFLFPPSLQVNAGSGGIVLDTDLILFPSPNGDLHLGTSQGGDFRSYVDPNDSATVYSFTLSMSDSASRQWSPGGNVAAFGLTDHAAVPAELSNLNPVQINISGSIKNLTVRTTKATQVRVGGDMFNASLLAENLHGSDVTSITAGGNISYSPSYAFTHLAHAIQGADPQLPEAWDAIFSFMVNANVSLQVPPDVLLMTPAQQTAYAYSHLRLVLRDGYQLQPGYDPNSNPGFIYDPATLQLGFQYQMNSTILSALNRAEIPILKLDALGNVMVETHADGKFYFATTAAAFAPSASLQDLFYRSLSSVKNANSLPSGFQIGGPGKLQINAASMDLGSSGGVISWGVGSSYNPINYQFLTPFTPSGAALDIELTGDLTLLSSTIASIYGGDLLVKSGRNIGLSQGDFALIPPGAGVSYGIFSSGHSDVTVLAEKDIMIGGARIGTFNGGNVFVRSERGEVNAGNGANSILVVPVIRTEAATGVLTSDSISDPKPFGSGIMAISPTAVYRAPGSGGLPGNITVETPLGDIVSTLGGIQQFALNGSVAGGSTITLAAGTPGPDGFAGNVNLGQGGIIGGTINIRAQGSISGLIVSRQNANINAAQSFSGTLLSGGTANVTASAGTVSGTVIGIGGVNASGGAGVTASVLGQNVSIGGASAQSTLGTTASATSAGQAAAQQANADTQQLLAKSTSDEDDLNKKKAKGAVLVRRVGRVTVILPPNS